MLYYKHINWSESKNHDGNITYWHGKINNRFMFEIYQFKNEMFTDPFIMTSRMIPMDMKISNDLDELKETAQTLMEAFVKNFYHS